MIGSISPDNGNRFRIRHNLYPIQQCIFSRQCLPKLTIRQYKRYLQSRLNYGLPTSKQTECPQYRTGNNTTSWIHRVHSIHTTRIVINQRRTLPCNWDLNGPDWAQSFIINRISALGKHQLIRDGTIQNASKIVSTSPRNIRIVALYISLYWKSGARAIFFVLNDGMNREPKIILI